MEASTADVVDSDSCYARSRTPCTVPVTADADTDTDANGGSSSSADADARSGWHHATLATRHNGNGSGLLRRPAGARGTYRVCKLNGNALAPTTADPHSVHGHDQVKTRQGDQSPHTNAVVKLWR